MSDWALLADASAAGTSAVTELHKRIRETVTAWAADYPGTGAMVIGRTEHRVQPGSLAAVQTGEFRITVQGQSAPGNAGPVRDIAADAVVPDIG
jgi:hypothetical protein